MCCMGSECIDQVDTITEVDLAGMSGQLPLIFGTMFMVCRRLSTIARAIGWPCRAVFVAHVRELVVGAARLDSGMCVCATVAFCHVDDEGSLLVRFFVWVFL